MKGPIEIRPGVYGLGTDVVNWYLVTTDDGAVAVDAGLSGFVKTLDDDLHQIGRARADIAAVVLTHSDSDHTGVAAALKEAGARVLIHELDEPAIRKPGPKKGDASLRHVLPNVWRPGPRKVFIDMMRSGAKPVKVEGAERFADGDVLDVPGSPRVVHTPGHTFGHCAIHFEGHGALFVGDALCAHEWVTGDAGVSLMWPFVNEDNAAAVASLGVIEQVEADVVLFGHGDPWRDGPRAAVARARAKL